MTAGSILRAAQCAAALSRIVESAPRIWTIAGIEAWCIESDMIGMFPDCLALRGADGAAGGGCGKPGGLASHLGGSPVMQTMRRGRGRVTTDRRGRAAGS